MLAVDEDVDAEVVEEEAREGEGEYQLFLQVSDLFCSMRGVVRVRDDVPLGLREVGFNLRLSE